jgi:hypothetical protein
LAELPGEAHITDGVLEVGPVGIILFSILMLKPDAESSIDEPAKKNNAWERG